MPTADRAAVTAAYEDLRPWIVSTAAKFAKAHQWPPDDCVGWANLFFLEAYHSHDPKKGGLRQRVVHRIWWGLFEIHRTWCRRNAIAAEVRLTARNRPTKREPAPFDGFADDPGADARTVLRLLLTSPDLDADVRQDPNTNPGNIRNHLRRHLRAAGWTGPRIETAFAAVRSALA